LENNEGKGSTEFYLTPQKMKKIQEVSAGHLLNLEWNFHQLGIECITLDSSSIDDCYQILLSFFESRKRIRV
jgi:hypothetical protein